MPRHWTKESFVGNGDACKHGSEITLTSVDELGYAPIQMNELSIVSLAIFASAKVAFHKSEPNMVTE